MLELRVIPAEWWPPDEHYEVETQIRVAYFNPHVVAVVAPVEEGKTWSFARRPYTAPYAYYYSPPPLTPDGTALANVSTLVTNGVSFYVLGCQKDLASVILHASHQNFVVNGKIVHFDPTRGGELTWTTPASTTITGY